jgi:hypothetical protein
MKLTQGKHGDFCETEVIIDLLCILKLVGITRNNRGGSLPRVLWFQQATSLLNKKIKIKSRAVISRSFLSQQRLASHHITNHLSPQSSSPPKIEGNLKNAPISHFVSPPRRDRVPSPRSLYFTRSLFQAILATSLTITRALTLTLTLTRT